MSVSPARRAAYEVLLRVFEQDAYADRVFRSAARGLDERDRAFAQRLAYGAVQRVRTLDHAIETLGKRPVRKLDPPVRAALRLGAYQLGYTDTAPHAAANESVELVRRARLERAVPFTNAVMRRLADGIRPLLDALPDGPLKESYPDWIYETCVRDLGARRRARADARDERAARDGRPARRAASRRPAPSRPTSPARTASSASTTSPSPTGRIWPQSRGSQLAGLVVGSQDGERVLDLCAAPGGKTTQLRGEVTAVELDPNRASELRDEPRAAAARRTSPSSRPTGRSCRRSSTASTARSSTRRAPGLGVLAQRPDLRWRAQPLPELQLALLRSAAERVRPGGTIVYSVCTINADENEAVVDASGLRVAAARRGVAARSRIRARPEFLLTLPHVHGTSGFFVARLPRLRPSRTCRRGLAGLDPDGRDRAVALRGRLRAPRRADRGAAARRRARLPLRRRRRPLRRAGHDRADRARSRSRRSCTRHGGVLDCHLMVDNPLRHFPQIAQRRRRQRHLPLRGRSTTCPRRSPPRASTGSQVGVAFNPETRAGGRRGRRRRTPTSSSA